MGRTRIKICGLKDPAHAAAAAAAGADAIGLVFHADSPRAVSLDQARAICAAVPAFVTTVGLFVDAEPARIDAVLDAVPLQMLQFHGDESPTDCTAHGVPYLKAVRMRPGLDVDAAIAAHPAAAGVLLDAYTPGTPGGTGERFDWGRVPVSTRPLVLAGGLDVDNVAEAIGCVRPFAVDVSGGVERRRGEKDEELIMRFCDAVRRADALQERCGPTGTSGATP